MGDGGFVDLDQARELVRSAMNAVSELRDGAYWKIGADDLLSLGQEFQGLPRMVYAANVHLAGEVDTQGVAKQRSCPSTAALLRQVLLISPAEAHGRLGAARQILPQEVLTGGDLPPTLPALATAVDTGTVGSEHVKTIVATMPKLPAALPIPDRDLWEKFLVGKAALLDPRQLEVVAAAVLEAADPDGTLDEGDAKSKMELSIGSRSACTGLTRLSGLLDDHGVDVLRKAIDGLAAPKPDVDGMQDPRPAATRRAHALVSALAGFLAAGTGPTNGGERPQVIVYLHWDQLTGEVSRATRESGVSMTTGEARRYLCDANIVPVVLGGAGWCWVVLGGRGEMLDVGRSSRTYSVGMRRAIRARDRGCVWECLGWL